MTVMDKIILDYITTYIQEHGYSPSVREIAAGVGLKSTSSVQAHIKKLVEAGKLETDAGISSPRALRVSGYIFVPGEYPYEVVCDHCGEEYIQAGHRKYEFCPLCGCKRN